MLKEGRSSIFPALTLAVVMLFGAPYPGFGQSVQQGQPAPLAPATTPPGPLGSVPAPSPASPTVAAPIKEKKELKETKEVKDRPSDWVQLVGAIAWPFCLLLIAVMLLFSRTGKRIFGLFPKVIRKISAGGVEMQISADAVDEIREYLRDSFDELIARAKDEYQRMASVQQISTHLGRVMDGALPRVLQANHIPALPDNIRSTIHVPDIVFSSYLYQLGPVLN
jgi:hypothetical protein